MISARCLRLALALGSVLGGRAWADAPESGLAAAKVAAVEGLLRDAMEREGIPGLSAAIVLDAKLAWSGGLGMADVENGVRASPETVYRLASLSKPITAVAAMQLAESGKLDLDAPIQAYVPSFPRKPWTVTARQLLGHLGGIRAYDGDEWDSTRRYVSILDGLDVFKDSPLACEPGTRYLYSTYGYVLLGAAVEAACGQSYMDCVRARIFVPAGMDTARDDDAQAIVPGRAHGYERTASGELRNASLADTSYKIPGGGLCSTVGDVARFGAAFLSGRLVRPETTARMLAPQKTRDGRTVGYGLGWTLASTGGRREAWHTGGQQGASNVLYLQPDLGTAVVVLSNLERVEGDLPPLARRIAAIVRP